MENRKSETIWVKDGPQLLFSKFAFAHASSWAPPASSPHFTVYLAVISIFLQQPAAEQPQHLQRQKSNVVPKRNSFKVIKWKIILKSDQKEAGQMI